MRKVFVASSTQQLENADHVCSVLGTVGDVEGRLWKEFFEPGSLTLEALELMLNECCAAVIVAGPDDAAVVGGRDVSLPRANVMLEFGLVAGRIGRHSVAVCQYGGAELPSDMAGMTVIRMDPTEDAADADAFRRAAEARLKLWSSRLIGTADGVPRTELFHGYSGRWNFDMQLQTWRDLQVSTPGNVSVRGHIDLVIPASGEAGRGSSIGRIVFKVRRPGSSEPFYEGEYQTVHEVSDVNCKTDGSLQFTTTAFALEKTREATGTPPLELEQWDFQPEPWSAHWDLSPGSEARHMTGSVRSEGSIVTQGTVSIRRDS